MVVSVVLLALPSLEPLYSGVLRAGDYFGLLLIVTGSFNGCTVNREN